LPSEYDESGNKWSHHFCTIYAWLAVTAVSLLCLTWTHPSTEKKIQPVIKIEEIKGEKKNG
jgi:hypothetical protein